MRDKIEMNVVRDNLKVARLKAGLTQGEAAERVGISRQTLNSYEQDPRVITYDMFVKLANAYGCTLRFFFGI